MNDDEPRHEPQLRKESYKMPDGSDSPNWQDTLELCGLQVTTTAAPQDVTPVQTAIYAAAGFEVEPAVAIPAKSAQAVDELDQQWHLYASTTSLYSDSGEFLILPPVSGGSKIGWVQVRDLVGSNLPSRIAAVTGSREFLTLSLDGHHLCAVTEEEDDYWVVVREFS